MFVRDLPYERCHVQGDRAQNPHPLAGNERAKSGPLIGVGWGKIACVHQVCITYIHIYYTYVHVFTCIYYSYIYIYIYIYVYIYIYHHAWHFNRLFVTLPYGSFFLYNAQVKTMPGARMAHPMALPSSPHLCLTCRVTIAITSFSVDSKRNSPNKSTRGGHWTLQKVARTFPQPVRCLGRPPIVGWGASEKGTRQPSKQI